MSWSRLAWKEDNQGPFRVWDKEQLGKKLTSNQVDNLMCLCSRECESVSVYQVRDNLRKNLLKGNSYNGYCKLVLL